MTGKAVEVLGTSVDVYESSGYPTVESLPEFRSPLSGPFLMAYRQTGTLKAAAELVGCTPQSHERWKKTDPVYAEAYQAFKTESNHMIEALLHDRVVNGVSDKRYNKDGELMFTNVRHDATLMKLMLAGRMPEKYGNDKGVGNVNIVVVRTKE